MSDRERLRDIFSDYLENHGTDVWPPPLVVKAYMGSGKTVSVLRLADLSGYRIIYSAPRHDIIDELKENGAVAPMLHLKGRRQLGMCMFPEYADMEALFSLSGYCKDCVYLETCPYYLTKKEVEELPPKTFACVHSHMTSFLPDFLKMHDRKEMYDALIVDENPTKSFMVEKTISLSNVRKLTQSFSSLMPKTTEVKAMTKILRAMCKTDIDYSVIKENFSLDYDDTYEIWNSVLMSLFIGGEKELLPPTDIVKEIATASRLYGRTAVDVRDVFYWYEDWLNETSGMTVKYFNPSFIRELDIPIIILDGAADFEYYEMLLNRRIVRREIAKEMGREYYCHSNSNSLCITSLISNDEDVAAAVGRKLTSMALKYLDFAELVHRNIVGDRKCVTLVSSKRAEVLLRAEMERRGYRCSSVKEMKEEPFSTCVIDFLFLHYQNTSGLNVVYDTSDNMIVLMPSHIPTIVLETDERLSEISKQVWKRMLGKDEVLQAIGRERCFSDLTSGGLPRGRRNIYILTNEVIGLCDNFKSFKQMEEIARGRMRMDCAPLSDQQVDAFRIMLDLPDGISEVEKEVRKRMKISSINLRPVFDVWRDGRESRTR